MSIDGEKLAEAWSFTWRIGPALVLALNLERIAYLETSFLTGEPVPDHIKSSLVLLVRHLASAVWIVCKSDPWFPLWCAVGASVYLACWLAQRGLTPQES